MTEIEILIKTVVEDTRKALKGVSEDLKEVGNSGGGLSGIGEKLGEVGRIAGGLALQGLQALGTGLVDLIQDAAEAEKIQAALNAVLTSTKGAAGVTAEAANDLADALAKVTPFEADVVVGAENMLLTFTNIHKEVFPRATETVLNLATAMGGDTKGAAIQLGKALNDPIAGVSALSRVGVTFTEQQKEQIKVLQESGDMIGAQTIVLNELQTEFGGAARAAGQTFAGQMAIAQHTIDDVVGAIGDALLPLITPLIGKFSELAAQAIPLVEDAMASIIQWIQVLSDKVEGIMGSGGSIPGAIAFFTDTFFQAKTYVQEIIESLVLIWTIEFNAAANFFEENSDDIMGTFQTTWNQIKTIIATAVAIVKIVLRELAVFIAAHGTEIEALFKGAWEIIKGTVDGVLTLIGGILKAALQLMQGDTDGALNTLKGTFTRVWEDIKGIVKGAWDFISNIVNLAIDAINRLSGAQSQAANTNTQSPLGGSYGTQSIRSTNFALGGDTFNINGGMDTARAIQRSRAQASRQAQLLAAYG